MLQAAVASIMVDEVKVTSTFISLSEEIEITRALTISGDCGAPYCTLERLDSGSSRRRHFFVDGNAVSIIGLNMTNGFVGAYNKGGAVYVSAGASVSFTSCIFFQNRALNNNAEQGGAIYAAGGSNMILQSCFCSKRCP